MILTNEAAFHQYATSEAFALDIPKIASFGDPIEDYRVTAGFYSTGDSGVWVLPAEDFGTLFNWQLGERLPLDDLARAFAIQRKPLIASLFPDRELGHDSLLERIRARRSLIQSKRGLLSDSVRPIREDRER